jgi:septal ring factor EnvC (AmiA/AmiB activator)
MAVEFMPSGSVLILSGETPYGGYEPSVAPVYYRVPLEGPRFFRNLMLWATGNYRELTTMIQQAQAVSQLAADVQTVKNDVAGVKSDVAALKNNVAALQSDLAAVKNGVSQVSGQLGTVSGQVNSLSGQMADLNKKIDQLTQQLNAAVAEANNAKTTGLAGTALALVFAIAAAVLALRRGKTSAAEGTKTR